MDIFFLQKEEYPIFACSIMLIIAEQKNSEWEYNSQISIKWKTNPRDCMNTHPLHFQTHPLGLYLTYIMNTRS